MPSLPFELERLIFEIAALQDINNNHRIQIILVAKRVYEWIRPILYRVAVIRGRNDLLETSGALSVHIENWPNPQFTNSARFVRHLCVTIPSLKYSHQLIDILSSSPDIEDFASWGGTISCKILRKMNQLPLRRLSLYLGLTSLREAIKHCPAFKNLTHLEIFGSNDLEALIHLPKLTHLSFFFSGYVPVPVVLDLLKHCVALRVLIRVTTLGREHSKLDDPRYLVLRDTPTIQDSIEEWARSANGFIGCWELAEVIIEARKANLFKDTAPAVLSQMTWMEHLNDDGRRWYQECFERNWERMGATAGGRSQH